MKSESPAKLSHPIDIWTSLSAPQKVFHDEPPSALCLASWQQNIITAPHIHTHGASNPP